MISVFIYELGAIELQRTLVIFVLVQCRNQRIIVSYLTLVSDLDLAPPTDQFFTSPPIPLDTIERCPGVVKI